MTQVLILEKKSKQISIHILGENLRRLISIYIAQPL